MLVKHYHRALSSGMFPEEIKAKRLTESNVLDPAKAAIELAQDAFRTGVPPTYYLADIPAHCLHLDILSIADLSAACEKGADEVDALLEKTLHEKEQAWFCFLRHEGPSEIEQFCGADEIYALAVRLSRLDNQERSSRKFSGLIDWIPDVNGHVPFYNSSIPSTAIAARIAAIVILFMSMFPVHERRRVLQQIHDMCSKCDELRKKTIANLSQIGQCDTMLNMINDYQMFLTVEIMQLGEADDDHVVNAADALRILYEANFYLAQESGIVSYDKFYSGFADDFDEEMLKRDFVRTQEGFKFSFSRYRFLLKPAHKAFLLQLEGHVERSGAMRQAIFSSIFSGPNPNGLRDFFCYLSIDRNNLVETTVRELRRNSENLKKPLRVQFRGEEGIDEGGPTKEFFQLVCKALLDPNYNMFREFENSGTLWFVPEVQNSICKLEFFLIGQLLGLAVYNNVILDVAFPLAAFKKLLGVPVSFSDLEVVDPGLTKGLKDLLGFVESDGLTVEEVYCRTFTYEHEVFGQHIDVPLVPGGESIVVTAANRQQFVDAMVHYVLNTSIESNFKEFKNGFSSLCGRVFGDSLRPEELELLVCGKRELNFKELEESTSYEGFSATDVTIRNFWEVVHEFNDAQQREFLMFCTGSDRSPVGGLRDLSFVVGKNGDDSDLLPTSHTCFNHLLLPAYKSKEKLKQKLLVAIQNCKGFGLK